MRLLGKTAIVAGLAGAMALGSMTASQARFRAGPAVAAGAAGFALGAAAANANAGYYGSGYDSYAYEPGYSSYGYSYEPRGYDGYAYSPGYSYEGSYNSNNNGPWHERQLQGRDW